MLYDQSLSFLTENNYRILSSDIASGCVILIINVGWLVGWLVDFGFDGPLRQCFSLYRAVSQREGERGKKG